MCKKIMLVAVMSVFLMSSSFSFADIFSAIDSADTDEIDRALKTNDVNGTNEDGQTPLMYAIEQSDVDTINYLVTKGLKKKMNINEVNSNG